jgi:energy-converting hydrogenase Eha subunit H
MDNCAMSKRTTSKIGECYITALFPEVLRVMGGFEKDGIVPFYAPSLQLLRRHGLRQVLRLRLRQVIRRLHRLRPRSLLGLRIRPPHCLFKQIQVRTHRF